MILIVMVMVMMVMQIMVMMMILMMKIMVMMMRALLRLRRGSNLQRWSYKVCEANLKLLFLEGLFT